MISTVILTRAFSGASFKKSWMMSDVFRFWSISRYRPNGSPVLSRLCRNHLVVPSATSFISLPFGEGPRLPSVSELRLVPKPNGADRQVQQSWACYSTTVYRFLIQQTNNIIATPKVRRIRISLSVRMGMTTEPSYDPTYSFVENIKRNRQKCSNNQHE